MKKYLAYLVLFAAVVILPQLIFAQEAKNPNIGTIQIRAIVANIDEVGNKYGSNGEKFSKAKLKETELALKRLNKFVSNSSYKQAKLKWKVGGVYELGSGVCNKETYGEKVDELIRRSLEAADKQSPIQDYSYYVIIHPMPDCQNGEVWTFQGSSTFKPYSVNGKTVHMRGINLSDLSDQYLFHEFGHTLSSAIGHPDYLRCPITTSGNTVNLEISKSCQNEFDFYSESTPKFTMMATPNTVSDYSAIEKEKAGWLKKTNVATATIAKYELSSLEKPGADLKVLKIPVAGTGKVVYLSFRQPLGYKYPATEGIKPNGVIMDISNIASGSFLITNGINKDAPLAIGTSYRIGSAGIYVTVTGIKNNIASITVSSNPVGKNSTVIVPPTTNAATTKSVTTTTPAPTCKLSTDKTTYRLGETITFNWTSQYATYATWKQDTSGKDTLWLPGDKFNGNDSALVTANVIGNINVTLQVGGYGGIGTCSHVVSIY